MNDELAARLRALVADEAPVALATVVEGPHVGATLLVPDAGTPQGSLGDEELSRVVARDARAALAAGNTGLRHYGPSGEARRAEVAVFVQSFVSPPRMVICGAVDFTAALADVARLLGYRVLVVDARAVFATEARFPTADEVVVEWPDRVIDALEPRPGPRDAVCVLTHDAKFDVPALRAALATDAGYIGAMGSRRTHADRIARLLEAGVGEHDLERVMAPIGLDLGARTPEETAIAIGAEIIGLRSGRSVPSLRDGTGPIHGRSAG